MLKPGFLNPQINTYVTVHLWNFNVLFQKTNLASATIQTGCGYHLKMLWLLAGSDILEVKIKQTAKKNRVVLKDGCLMHSACGA